MADEEFQCRAINDYHASVSDELDLKEGQIYIIMQVSNHPHSLTSTKLCT